MLFSPGGIRYTANVRNLDQDDWLLRSAGIIKI
jgi:hypothetical protein